NSSTTSTSAIAVSLQSPIHIDGLEEKHPSFQAWKRASYNFLRQEFGQQNLVYLHLARVKTIPTIHCIFVPVKSSKLLPQAFVDTQAQQEGYLDRYQAVLARLWEQAKQLPALEKYPTYTLNSSKFPNPLTNGFHETIKTELERVKKEVNIINFALSRGYQVNKKKSCRSYMVLDQGKGTPKLLMPTRPNNKGYWFYKSLSDDKDKGTIVDFMLQRGHSYQEIARLSNPALALPSQVLNQQRDLPEQIQDPALQQELAQAKFARFPSGWGITYLEKRGIEPVTHQGIKGIKANSKGAIFGLYDKINIKGEGRLCSTIEYQLQADGSSKKRFQKDLPRGISILPPSKAVKEIVATESPIESLSHKQLHGTAHTLYLATCGRIGQKIAQILEGIFIQAKQQGIGVTLGFNDDEEGRKMAKQVTEIASRQGITCQKDWPSKGKDWNEELVASNEQIYQVNKQKNSMAFARTL
ncbi:MAG: toprim domain-containing protein, partial [Candidatus Amoebophilus sp.]